MAVVLRLQRTGKPKQAHYRVVAIDKKQAIGGEAIEVLGHYHPLSEKTKDQVTLDIKRVDHWLKVGAKASETVQTLIRTVRKTTNIAA